MEPYPGTGHSLQAALLGGQPAAIVDAPWRNVLTPPEAARIAAVAAALAGETARPLVVFHSEPRKGNNFNPLPNGPLWHDIR